ncbi:MAG: hypothetical protein KQ78_01825 [Candidatus Izimaplasma bacterium HR2]|nr:MAG: hypothetical protein KQ78_01825 [Candidatus Izimaplasma bacterium HR2]
MFYRLEFFDDIVNEWVGMFRDMNIPDEMHRNLYNTTASYQFKRNLPIINPQDYSLNEKIGHCYFTEKGMEEFGKYVEEFKNILVTNFITKILAVKENTYEIAFRDSLQVVLIDRS